MLRLRLRLAGTGAGLCAMLAALVVAAPAEAVPALGSIATLAGGQPSNPVAATTVGQRPGSVASVTLGGVTYVYTADTANSVVTRVNESSGLLEPVAGVGAAGHSGDGAPATQSALANPAGVAVDSAGDVFIADGGTRVRFVPASTGIFFNQAMTAGDIYTIAGNGTAGFSGDGGPATSGEINDGPFFMFPGGQIAVDAQGDLAIADNRNQRVRFVPARTDVYFGRSMTGGDIYTIAGNGSEGFSGDGKAAESAELNLPLDVSFDGAGNLAIDDEQNYRVRFVSARTESQYGQSMSTGDIYTIAGNGKNEYAGEGLAATGGGIGQPQAVALDSAGDLVIGETGFSYRARLVPKSSGNFFGAARTADDIYTIAGDGTFGFSGDTGIATGAQLSTVQGVSIDSSGSLLLADSGNNRIRFEPQTTTSLFGGFREEDHIYTVAGNGTTGFSGDGLPATETQLSTPVGIALRPSGGLAIADFANNRVRFVAAGTGAFGQAMTAGDLYTIAGDGTGSFGGDGGPGTSAHVSEPEGVAFDSAGDLVIGDRFNYRVRFMPASSGTFFGQAMTANDIYTIAGTGTKGFSGDGGPATAAELNEPAGVSFDARGDVLVADAQNYRVRFIPAGSGTFYGQAMTADHIYTVAGNGKEGFSGDGGPATAAEMKGVWSVGVDAAGDLAIANSDNHRVRFVPVTSGTFYGQAMIADHIYTIAGTGTSGSAGDGGPAIGAQLSTPTGIALDAAGDLAIADEGNNRVRFVPVRDGTYFGIAMSANDIYTIAGTGTEGFSGDGGPATAAELFQPDGPVFDSAGDVIFSDVANNRVRIVYATGPPASGGAGPPTAISTSRRGAPVLGAVRQSHSVWREGSRLARLSRSVHRPPLGTTYSFTLDQSATVTLRFTQKVTGRRSGRRCVARTRRNAGRKHCTLTLTRATLAVPAHAGADKIAFQGRVSRTRKLRPGRYTVVIRATNSAGASAARSLTFTIVR